MAINFLNTVDLNSIQIENIVPENLTAATRGAGVLGQMYFDTGEDTMMQYVADSDGGGNPGYIEIGATSAVETLIAGTGIGVSAAIGNITVRNTGLVTVLDGTFIDLTKQGGGDNTELTADLSAVDGTSTAADRFLTKNNKWATIPFGDITAVLPGTYINVDDSTGPEPTINHDLTTRPANTTSSNSPGYGGTFTVIDSVTSNTTGHVTAANELTITLPADTNETYTLPTTSGVVAPSAPTTGIISLTAGGTGSGVKSTVTFTGTTNRIDISGSAVGQAGTIIVDLTDDVTIVDDLTVGGKITQSQTGETNSLASQLDMNGNKILDVGTGTLGTDGVNLGQVELLVAGVGVFKGGYNATTDPGVPVISGASNIALDQGDYFVVSHDGDITFSGTTTTGVNDGALASSTALLLTTPNADVAAGMDVTGTGVPPGITIATVTDSSNFVLSSAITLANTTTLTFSDKVVSVEVGDFIFANAAITASSDPAASAYTIVQSDANIAGAGATDGATEKGVSGFDSASFDVSASGWVQLNSQRNPYGVSQTLDDTPPCARVYLNGLTTFTIDLDDASLFGTGALAKNVTVEVTRNAAPYQTVYADVTRSGSASMDIIFSGSIAVDLYRVLLTHI